MEKENNFTCRKCKISKDVSDFVKVRTRNRGHHPYCRLCQNKIKNNKRSLEYSLKWQKDNPQKRSIIKKRWYLKNPELVRLYGGYRRERERLQCDGTLNKQSLKKLSKKSCSICKKDLDWKTKGAVHLDHIKPLSKGGKHSITNVQWTCSICNLSKGSKYK